MFWVCDDTHADDLRYPFWVTSSTTVLWRMFRQGRDAARAVILPGGPPFTLAFFANDQMERVENYDSMEIVLFRADEVRGSLESDGWSESTSGEPQDSEERTANSE
jgi:hypothetical protein